MATMPSQKPGRSEQSVATPPEFIKAVLNRLATNDFRIDLAASEQNRVTHEYISKEENSFAVNWEYNGWCWLNPPYSELFLWVEKAWNDSQEFGTQIAMLVPASTGTNWWAGYVDGKAYITFLNGRITFVGHDAPYPKDLALLLYAPYLQGGSCVWRWR